MLSPDHCAVEPDAARVGGLIEPAVGEAGGHQVVHRITGQRLRNQSAGEKARHRRVAIGEVKDVRLFLVHFEKRCPPDAGTRLIGLQFQALEARHLQAPAIQRRDRVDSYPIEIVSHGLEERNHAWRHLHDIEQEVPIAHSRESSLLLG